MNRRGKQDIKAKAQPKDSKTAKPPAKVQEKPKEADKPKENKKEPEKTKDQGKSEIKVSAEVGNNNESKINELENLIKEKDALIEELNKKCGTKSILSEENFFFELPGLDKGLLITQLNIEKIKLLCVENTINISLPNAKASEIDNLKFLNGNLENENNQLKVKIDEDKIKVKKLIFVVNEKFSNISKKNHALSKSISDITNNISKAEKEKYDLEEIIFKQEDYIEELGQNIDKLQKIINEKNDRLEDDRYMISSLNDRLLYLQQKEDIRHKIFQNCSEKKLVIPKIKLKKNIQIDFNSNNNDISGNPRPYPLSSYFFDSPGVSVMHRMQNISKSSVLNRYSNRNKVLLGGVLNKPNKSQCNGLTKIDDLKKIYDYNVINNEEKINISSENKYFRKDFNKVFDERQKQKVSEVKNMMDNLIGELSFN